MNGGDDLVALSAMLAIKFSDCLNFEGLCELLEFLGLLRHNLEVIKVRRLVEKVEHRTEKKKHL